MSSFYFQAGGVHIISTNMGGGDATVENSKVGGTLTCASNHLVIEGSEIDTIDLRCSGGFGGISIRTGGISIGSGNFGSSSVSIGNGFFGSISIGGGTNPNNIFIDGVPLSQLQAKQPSSAGKKEAGPRQILELRNSKVKNVIFEGGNGEVVFSGNSSLTGSITGAKVRA